MDTGGEVVKVERIWGILKDEGVKHAQKWKNGFVSNQKEGKL